MNIALVGATGFVARRAAEKLATAAELTLLARHPEKVRVKARIELGDLTDAEFVMRATRGTQALLWLTPTSFTAPDLRAYTLRLAQNAAAAIRENGIERVVFISSHGAHRAGAGQVSYAGEVEAILETAAANTVVLRSAGFMENLFTSIDSLKNGQLFGVLLPEKRYPLVTTRDLGDVAATWLADPTWTGHQVHGVHGPEDLSALDQASIIGRVLGQPIRYQQIPPEALRENFVKRGASPSVAQASFEMFKTFAQTSYVPKEPRTPDTTTPTTLETFVREVLLPRLKEGLNTPGGLTGIGWDPVPFASSLLRRR